MQMIFIPAMMVDLAILANLASWGKFSQICEIGQNYANDFNRCHPAMMADLAKCHQICQIS